MTVNGTRSAKGFGAKCKRKEKKREREKKNEVVITNPVKGMK